MPTQLPPRCAELFQLGDPIAVGGFGAVYRGTQLKLGRPVAIKLLHARSAAQPDTLERFKAEARISASIVHPHVVKVLDADVEDGFPWIVYEFVDGPTLRTRMQDGPVPWPIAVRLAAQIASALGAAHAAGVLHRDVKPENVMEAPPGFARVTDFGIAHWVGGAMLTQTGYLIGTPTYVSPEMANGGRATPASDLYALGVMMYEMMTARRPYIARNVAGMLDAHIKAPVPRLDGALLGIPEPVVQLVADLMGKHAAQRPSDANRVSADLEAILAASEDISTFTGQISARPAGHPVPAAARGSEPARAAPRRPRARRTRIPIPRATAAAAGTALVFAMLLALFGQRLSAPPVPRAAPPSAAEDVVALGFAILDRHEVEHDASSREYANVQRLTASPDRDAQEKAARLARQQSELARTRLNELDDLAGRLDGRDESTNAVLLHAELEVARAYITMRLDRVNQRVRMAERAIAERLDTPDAFPRLLELEQDIQYEPANLTAMKRCFASLILLAERLRERPAEAPVRAGALFARVLRLGDQFNVYRFRGDAQAGFTSAIARWSGDVVGPERGTGFQPGAFLRDLFTLGVSGDPRRQPHILAQVVEGITHARRAMPRAATALDETSRALREYAPRER